MKRGVAYTYEGRKVGWSLLRTGRGPGWSWRQARFPVISDAALRAMLGFLARTVE